MPHLAVQPPSRSDPTVGKLSLCLPCHVLSRLVVRHYTSPYLSWWTVQGSPHQPAQLQIHRSSSSISTCRVFHSFVGGGMLARWNCPVCATAASLRPNGNGIEGWQPATCYSPALARPAACTTLTAPSPLVTAARRAANVSRAKCLSQCIANYGKRPALSMRVCQRQTTFQNPCMPITFPNPTLPT